jgi:rubredoxin
MKVYKAKVNIELVITAEDELLAKGVFNELFSVVTDGMNVKLVLKEITDIKDLPKGWKGEDLAFMSRRHGSGEEKSIASHLKKNNKISCPMCQSPDYFTGTALKYPFDNYICCICGHVFNKGESK